MDQPANEDVQEEEEWLRVHSADLAFLVAEEAARAFDAQAHYDLLIQCKDKHQIKAHAIVLAASSNFLRKLLRRPHSVHAPSSDAPLLLCLPESSRETVSMLLEVVYTGSVEASLPELRETILLARALKVQIPVSQELLDVLEVPIEEEEEHDDSDHQGDDHDDVESGCQKATSRKREAAQIKEEVERTLPLPPPLKRIKTQSPGAASATLPMATPSPGHSPGPSYLAKGFLCPFCNSKYDNAVAFKNHLKFHESEALKEQRTQMMNEMVATCFDVSANLYECVVCNSTYSHPGNFKQHLGKHERETGAISSYFQAKDPNAFAGMVAASPTDTSADPSSGEGPSPSYASTSSSHLNDVLQSSFANRWDGRVPNASSSSSSAAAAQQKEPHFCDVCGRSFKHSGNYKQHMASHMRVSSIAFPSHLRTALDGSSVESGTTRCKRCDLKLETPEALRDHMRNVHTGGGNGMGGSNVCKICDESFDSKDLLEEHKTQAHHAVDPSAASQGDLFHCDVPTCQQSFSKESWLERHKQRDHKNLPLEEAKPQSFTCPVCKKTFFKMAKLNAHMKIHSAPEDHYRYPCDICGKKFTRPHHVTRHKLMHTGIKPHRCSKCNKAFTREDKLKDHLARGCDVLDGISFLGHPERTSTATSEDDHGEGDFDAAVEVALEEGEQDEDEYGSMEGLMIA